jgi:hypothetical protein
LKLSKEVIFFMSSLTTTQQLLPGSTATNVTKLQSSQLAATSRFNNLVLSQNRPDAFRAFQLPQQPSSSSSASASTQPLTAPLQKPVEGAVDINPVIKPQSIRPDRNIGFRFDPKLMNPTAASPGETKLGAIPKPGENALSTARRQANNIHNVTQSSFVTADIVERQMLQQNARTQFMPRDRSQGLDGMFARNAMLASQQSVSDLSDPSKIQGTFVFAAHSALDPSLPAMQSQFTIANPGKALKSLSS